MKKNIYIYIIFQKPQEGCLRFPSLVQATSINIIQDKQRGKFLARLHCVQSHKNRVWGGGGGSKINKKMEEDGEEEEGKKKNEKWN